MKNVKHIIAMFYIALILLFKVAGLHALSHQIDDSNSQHCEVCHITSVVSFIPLLETETPVVPKTEYYFLAQKTSFSAIPVVFNNKHLSSYPPTRPPPQLS
ncbi:MAG: hypothetical protein AB8B59_14320 [Maribacter sp.]